MQVLSSGLRGAAIGAILCAAAFFLGAMADGAGPAEALAYSLIVAALGLLLGGIVGAVVGLANLRAPGGAVVGLLATLAVVAFYVFAFGRPGELGYFLSESRVLIAGLAAPLTLTGAATAWLSTAREREEKTPE